MTRSRRYAVFVLLVGLVVAVGTPVYVANAAPSMAGYLLRPGLLIAQAVPYLLCAALWLPGRHPKKEGVAFVIGTLMLAGLLVVNGPVLWAPGRRGGDMVALTYVAVAAASTLGVLVFSAVSLFVLRLHRQGAKNDFETET